MILPYHEDAHTSFLGVQWRLLLGRRWGAGRGKTYHINRGTDGFAMHDDEDDVYDDSLGLSGKKDFIIAEEKDGSGRPGSLTKSVGALGYDYSIDAERGNR